VEVKYVDMEKIVQMAKLIALKQGYHAPMLFLDGTIAKAPMILEQFPDEHEGKIKYLYLVGKLFSKKHEIGMLNKVFFIMEAWMGYAASLDAVKKGKFIMPSQDPKRIEVLLISCLDIVTGAQSVKAIEYVRDRTGNLRELKDFSLPEGVTTESPLLPAFVAGYTGKV